MIIFNDLITGDEMFSDSFKYAKEDDDFFIKVQAKLTTEKVGGGISADLIGGNPSQEEGGGDEGEEEAGSKSGLDVVLIHKLEEQTELFPSKKDVQKYMKKWVKNVIKAPALCEDADKMGKFKTGCTKLLGKFCDLWSSDVSIYTGPKFDPEDCESSLLMCVWNEDGVSATIWGILPAMIEEKF